MSIVLYNGDCMDKLNYVDDNSVDLVLSDIPYGTTQCKWDTPLDLDQMWDHINRIKRNERTPTILFAQTPFDKVLGCSNLKSLKYEWIWEKTTASGHLNAKRCPMKAHENILVFYDKLPTYNPIMTLGHSPTNSYTKRHGDGECYGKTKIVTGGGSTTRYPRSVQTFKSDKQFCKLHPTQKPLKLISYLVSTYSNTSDTVLDFCMGSGTTGVASKILQRSFIGIELDYNYYEISKVRIENA